MKSTNSGGSKGKVELVKWIFEELDRGADSSVLLDQMAEDVLWKVTIPAGTPLSGEFRGKQAVAGFFTRLPEIVEFQELGSRDYIGREDKVIVLGDENYIVKKTGKTFRSEYAVVVDFHEGLITRMVVIQDLCGIADAYRSE